VEPLKECQGHSQREEIDEGQQHEVDGGKEGSREHDGRERWKPPQETAEERAPEQRLLHSGVRTAMTRMR
jgi:hypothetical protein